MTTESKVASYCPLEIANRPVWYRPTAPERPRLRVRNSLTETLEDFIPHEGNRVRWYTCKSFVCGLWWMVTETGFVCLAEVNDILVLIPCVFMDLSKLFSED